MARPATGTVLLKSGRFYARLTLPDGTRRDVALPRHYDERQARAKAAALNAYLRSGGTFVADGPATIGALATKWHELREGNPDLSEATKRQDKSVMKNHVLPTLRSMRADDCTSGVLRRWLRDLRAKHVVRAGESRPIAANTVRNAVATLTQFFEDCIAEDWLDLPANPMKHPAVRREVPEAETIAHAAEVTVTLSDAQVGALLDCSDVPEVRRLRYLVALTTGMRDGEIAGLRWCDVDFDGEVPYLRVRTAVALTGPNGHATRGEPKTKRSKRPIPLHPRALSALRHWHDLGWSKYVTKPIGTDENDGKPLPTDAVFPGPDGKVQRPKSGVLLRQDLQAAGQPTTCEGIEIDFHATRRTFGSRLLRAGVSEEIRKRLMGHAAGSVTGKHYTADDLATLRRGVLASLAETGVSSPVLSPNLSQPWDLNPRPAVYELPSQRGEASFPVRNRSDDFLPDPPEHVSSGGFVGSRSALAATLADAVARCLAVGDADGARVAADALARLVAAPVAVPAGVVDLAQERSKRTR